MILTSSKMHCSIIIGPNRYPSEIYFNVMSLFFRKVWMSQTIAKTYLEKFTQFQIDKSSKRISLERDGLIHGVFTSEFCQCPTMLINANGNKNRKWQTNNCHGYHTRKTRSSCGTTKNVYNICKIERIKT